MHRLFRHIITLTVATLASIGTCAGKQADVLVVGGGTSGIAAGIQSARMGASTIIVESTDWLGGMLTAAGVSAVDGNYRLRAGIWGEFLDSLTAHYGGLDNLKTGWVSNVLFEPSVGNAIFHSMAAAEPNLSIMQRSDVLELHRKDGLWHVKIKNDNIIDQIDAKIVIDATELGDIVRMCGIPYDIGMESRTVTQEDIAPINANGIIQDLTYVAILKDYGHDVTIHQPEGYDPSLYACCCANTLCTSPKEPDRVWSTDMMMSYGRLPNGKIMINWPIEGNDYYVDVIDLDPQARAEALQQAKNHTLGFIYFIQHELGLNTLGLDDETFPTADHLPLIPYHRESRRIHGKVRFDLNHIMRPYDQADPLYRTCIAVGDYPVDHHHQRYTGADSLPNLYFHPVPSYGLPLGTLIPNDCEGIIVAEKSISVSNIVNGSTRLQPVVLQIGQAAGALAAISVLNATPISDVSVRKVQNAILNAGGYLLPYLDVAPDSPYFKPLQRIGSTGILHGIGKNVDWSNETWFNADVNVNYSDLAYLSEYYNNIIDDIPTAALNQSVSINDAINIISRIATKDINNEVQAIALEYGWENYEPQRPILRKEFALLLDLIIDPFNQRQIDIKGHFLK